MALTLFSPWPTISRSGELAAGSLLELSLKCRTCEHRKCREFHGNASQNLNVLVCSKGLNCYAYKAKETVVFVGIGDPGRSDLPNSLRKAKEYLVAPAKVRTWLERTAEALTTAQLSMTEETERSIQGLHNIQPVVNMIVRAAEACITEFSGFTFEEQLKSASGPEKDIYYAADLLTWMINIQHDLVRPEAIDHGRRIAQPVYEMLHRFVRSFRLLGKASGKRVSIDGYCQIRPRCYSSIATLFFILLDNAVKYSLDGQEVKVRVNDSGNAVDIEVESFGPMVESDEVQRIFEPAYRGRNALRFSTEGSGRGLYVAKVIANKHGTYIDYRRTSGGHDLGGIACGTSIFSVQLFK